MFQRNVPRSKCQATLEPGTTLAASYWRQGETELYCLKSTFQMKVIFAFHLEIKSLAQNPSCLKSTVKFPQLARIWGAMSSTSVGPLCQRRHLLLYLIFKALHTSIC